MVRGAEVFAQLGGWVIVVERAGRARAVKRPYHPMAPGCEAPISGLCVYLTSPPLVLALSVTLVGFTLQGQL